MQKQRPLWRPISVTVAVMLMWLAGALMVRAVCVSQINTYGFEQSSAGPLDGDPFFLVVPSLLTIPLAVGVGWALHGSGYRWVVAIVCTAIAVPLAVYVPVFIVTLRFSGDRSPVDTFEIGFAWLVFCVTAGIHAVAAGVAAWRTR